MLLSTFIAVIIAVSGNIGVASAAPSVKQTGGKTVAAPAAKNVSTPARAGSTKTATAGGSVARSATVKSSSISKYLGSTSGALKSGAVVKVPELNIDMSNFVTQNQYDFLDMRIEFLELIQPDMSNYYTTSETNTLLNKKQDVLTAGTGINIINGVISSTVSASDFDDMQIKSNISQNFTTDSGSTTKYPSVKAVQDAIADAVTGGIGGIDLSGKQDVANLSQNIAADTGSTTKYPSVAAVETAITLATSDISGKENTSNKVTTISSTSTNTQYPSALAVYNAIDAATSNIATDMANKQDKASGVTADNVATWASDGNGKFQTAGERTITSTTAGIVTGNTGLTTGGAVADYVTSALSGLGSGSINSVSLETGTNDGTVKLTVNGAATDNIAVKNAEVTTNKVTTISASSTNTQYPSAKVVWDNMVNLTTAQTIAGNKTFTGTVIVPTPTLPSP